MEAGIPSYLPLQSTPQRTALPSPNPSLPSPKPLSPQCSPARLPKPTLSLLTAPSCLWCLWHFPLQHFQAPVAPPAPWLSQQQHEEAAEPAQGHSPKGWSHPRPRGVLHRPTQGKPHKFTPQSCSSGDAECSATGEPTPQWHSCEKHNPQGQQQSGRSRTDSTAPGIPTAK